MQQIDKRAFTRDDAYRLTEKLIRKGTSNYIIRDALIEQGMSAYMANEIITEVRRAHLHEIQTEENNISKTQVAMIIIALCILLIIFFGLVNPVS